MKRFLLAITALALFGFGCGKLPFLPSTENPPATKLTMSSPKDAANLIQFMSGDSFEVRQTVLGLGARLPDLTGSSVGVRHVTIKRFAPTNVADLAWVSTIERLAEPDPKSSSTLPKIETSIASGTISFIDLKTSHTLLLPVYWLPKDMLVTSDKSVVWLSDDAYRELSRTGKTVLNMGVVDQAANTIVKNLNELKNAWAKLRNQAVTEEKQKDLTLLEAEPERIEWPLKVNGQEIKVSVIRAKSWFGEAIILDSRQNPMVLKLTLNPALVGADLASKQGGLKSLFGYEISNLVVQSVK